MMKQNSIFKAFLFWGISFSLVERIQASDGDHFDKDMDFNSFMSWYQTDGYFDDFSTWLGSKRSSLNSEQKKEIVFALLEKQDNINYVEFLNNGIGQEELDNILPDILKKHILEQPMKKDSPDKLLPKLTFFYQKTHQKVEQRF